MTVTVGPSEKNPTHVFSLSDGTNEIGFITCNRQGEKSVVEGWSQTPMPRTALKTSSGAAKYEDFELPFTSIIQDDFSGGMNEEEFEDDKTKYRNGRHCDTIRGDIICGPNPTKATDLGVGYYLGSYDYDASGDDTNDPDENYLFLSSYTPTSTVTVSAIGAICNENHNKVRVYIYSSNTGTPNAQLAYKELEVSAGGNHLVYLDSTYELTGSVEYFIGFVARNDTDGHTTHYNKAETGKTLYWIKDGNSWQSYADNNACPIYLYITSKAREFMFFEYKRNLYAISNFDDGATPELYRNGYTGVCKSNSGDKSKLNTNLDLSGVDLTDCVAVIIDGPGSVEKQPWRVISSNTTTGSNDVITVVQPWKIAHTTSSIFSILGSDDWTKLTSTNLTKPITDIAVMRDYVVFCQGIGNDMDRYRIYNSSGSYTEDWETSSESFDRILSLQNLEGDEKIWGANIDQNTIYPADAEEWGADWTLGGAIWIGNKDSRIQDLIAYGDPRIPYIFKEDSFGSIANDIYAEVPIGEMAAVRSSYNGTALMAHGVYLYLNMGEKIERYYDRRLDDVGPDRGEGRPKNLKGIIRKMIPYPGRYYALLFSEGNVASILCFNGMGWNEVWRPTNVTSDGSGDTGDAAPFAYNVSDRANLRANDMIVQVIPGINADRLWFDFAGELNYLPITINPRKDSEYEYRDLSQLETAWIYGNLKDVEKYWHSIKIHSENLSSTDQSIKIEYKLDEDTTWTTAGYANTSPIDEVDLSSSYDVTGYRIKFRITLHTSSSSETPRIIAIVVKGVIRVDVKNGYSVRVISDAEYDLNGDEEDQGDVKSYLDTWANSETQAAPLTLSHNLTYYDNKYVFIDPASIVLQQVELNPVDKSLDRQYKEVVEFIMYEV